MAQLSDRFEQRIVLGMAAATDCEVDRGAGERARGIFTCQLHIDIHIENLPARAAARVTIFGSKKLIEV